MTELLRHLKLHKYEINNISYIYFARKWTDRLFCNQTNIMQINYYVQSTIHIYLEIKPHRNTINDYKYR
jgi:hypothetical protein